VAPSAAMPSDDQQELKRQLTEAQRGRRLAQTSYELSQENLKREKERNLMLEAQTPSDLVIQVVLAACVLFSYF
jgi:hypothetical protein